jgi:hypothetical protein
VANYDKKLSSGAFTNYVAAINAMPRVAFSFPISDVANFYAHYDLLTQRPTGNNLSPLDYYYIDASGASPLISNPNQRPITTVDYELGFAQVLNERKNASLTIAAFYKENRNMINQKLIVGAYPKTYIMYDNIDFSTVKGMSAAFDFRRTGGSKINVNYTLQFSDGSGSKANIFFIFLLFSAIKLKSPKLAPISTNTVGFFTSIMNLSNSLPYPSQQYMKVLSSNLSLSQTK